MKNKATIKYIKAVSRLNDSIVINFHMLPSKTIEKSLLDKYFLPSRDRKTWKTTVDNLGENTFEYFFNQLIKSKLLVESIEGLGSLGSPYIPSSFVCPLLDTITPDSMDYEIHIAIRKIKQEIGNFHEYLQKKLHYTSVELCRSLSAEQIDAVALSIYNIEKKGQGMIIGDQTGIGKGRVAASMIRYGYYNGFKPIFLSEKPNLFSDMYRDLVDIGSEKLVPFIINGRESKTHVKNSEGEIVYEALPKSEQLPILESHKVPKEYDYFMATYSQFNSPKTKFIKPNFLQAIARNNIIIMDEAHNASGSSNTGEFIQEVLRSCKGVTFLSATFAKRPDNMPVYAMKTALSEANLDNDKLVDAIIAGGVALQEVLSSQLVAEGQMIRRERSFEGVEVNYITLNNQAVEHAAIADNITQILRDIIEFQQDFISKMVEEDDTIKKAEYKEVEQRKGTKAAGVDSPPMFSKVFNLINQMLFAIKAEAVADRAIERLKEGKKPVIAFASTMGSFLEQMENEHGNPVGNGDKISNDFKEVIMRALRGVMRYTVTEPVFDEDTGEIIIKKEYKYYEVSSLSPDGQGEYYRIANNIVEASTGLSISPIDVVIDKIESAGYSVAEVTGRKMEVKPIKGQPHKGLVMTRKKLNVVDAFRQYNNNEVDCLMINQSGATGASAHAIVTSSVPAEKVKQRVMIILQAELDINKEVQKRGRINRTGQIIKPIYDYLNSAIPAEQRLMMMLQKKLKSLDANTTSNQKQSSKILTTNDFLNKYGDKVVTEYLKEKPELNKALGDPLKFEGDNKPMADGKVDIVESAAHKVSGRVAIMPVKDQEKFYADVMELYDNYITYLIQTDQYDLEVQVMNLEAETMESETAIAGKGGKSTFGQDSFIEKCQVNNLRKPYKREELDNIIKKSLDGREASVLMEEQRADHQEFAKNRSLHIQQDLEDKYKNLIVNIVSEKKYLKLPEGNRQAYYNQRVDELEKAKGAAIKKEREVANNRFSSLDSTFKFFQIGRGYNYPEQSDQTGSSSVKCVFLGYQIDKNKSNPYAPSAVVLRFAVANSLKYIVLASSGEQGEKIQSIKGLSYSLQNWESKEILDNWDNVISSFSTDKVIRYIVTGNLLQAFATYKGKLVSYTTNDGSTSKGILMPDSYNPDTRKGGDMVTVPIGKAKKVINGLSQGQSVYDADKKLGISRSWAGYIITVPANRNFKRVYTDTDIVVLTENTRDGFERQSGMMKANIDVENIDKVIDLLQTKHNLSITVSRNMFE
ncbi:MAG: strawberry notch family protein [Bacteroidota bacterium]